MAIWKNLSLLRRGRCLISDEGGAAAIVLVLALPVMVGGLALGAEAGFWFMKQRELQHAADLAAHAAAVAKRAGADPADLHEAALRVARGSGYEDVDDTLTVHSPPQSGAFAGDSGGVEVLIERQQPRYLTKIYANDPVALSARAVAAVQGGTTACVLSLSPSAPGALTVSGSTEVTFDGCDIASNSAASDSFLMQSGASVVSTGCVNTVGGAVTTANLTLTDCAAPNEGAPPAADPYAEVAEPAATGSCQNGSVGNSSSPTVVSPSENHASGVPAMRFCSGLDLKGEVTFEPGLYIIEGGDFTVNAGAQISGDGVTFFLADGVDARFNGSAALDFSAPTSGPFSGLLLFGSRTATGTSHVMNGSASSALDGALYVPAGHLDFSGNFSWSSGCTQLVASTIRFTGNSTLEVSCQAAGTTPVTVRQEVRLVE